SPARPEIRVEHGIGRRTRQVEVDGIVILPRNEFLNERVTFERRHVYLESYFLELGGDHSGAALKRRLPLHGQEREARRCSVRVFDEAVMVSIDEPNLCKQLLRARNVVGRLRNLL